MKKFKDLLIQGIDEDIQGTTIERLIKVKQTFESEMIYNGIKPTMELLTEWLQGLPSAVHIPYMNDDIIAWYEGTLRRKVKQHARKQAFKSTESERWLQMYWPQCGRTLYQMLYN